MCVPSPRFCRKVTLSWGKTSFTSSVVAAENVLDGNQPSQNLCLSVGQGPGKGCRVPLGGRRKHTVFMPISP